jgi:hypothetical protein
MDFQTLSFGDLQTGIWGVWWAGAQLLVGPDGSVLSQAARLAASGHADAWQMSGSHVELSAVPEGAAAPLLVANDSGGEPIGFEQLCRVRGTFAAGGTTHAVDCLGHRGARHGLEPAGFESVRDVAASFAPDEGLALVAARPRNSGGHERDLVTAAVFEAGHAAPVADPRLSTTYSLAGLPRRASLELWIEVEDSDEEGGTHQYPRRAAGEAVGPDLTASETPLELHVQLLRWHYRGQVGAGVYVLARAR